MKVYMVTFGNEISDDCVFTDYEQARQRLEEIRADEVAQAGESGHYAHWYELRVFELVGESK
jgi:hypothetical protein